MGAEARAQGNLLCDGCRIEGTVIRSIISPGVYVAPGATVRDSIVMTDAVIEAGAEVDRAILDKRVLVAAGAKVGWGEDNTPNSKWPERLNTGLTLVGKDAVDSRRSHGGPQRGDLSEGFSQGLCRRRSCERGDDRRIALIKRLLVFDIT